MLLCSDLFVVPINCMMVIFAPNYIKEKSCDLYYLGSNVCLVMSIVKLILTEMRALAPMLTASENLQTATARCLLQLCQPATE